jgi:hypothetical protein
MGYRLVAVITKKSSEEGLNKLSTFSCLEK